MFLATEQPMENSRTTSNLLVLDQAPPEEFMAKILSAGLKPTPDTVFVDGRTLYNPSGNPIQTNLFVHEEVHMIRQGPDPDAWWDKYLSDPIFRLEEEILAYQKQYKYAKTMIKDRNELFKFLNRLANDLSGPIYGNLCTKAEAMKKIKE